MTLHSRYKTVGAVSFEKPHIDPVTLKPVFRERITWSSSPQITGATIDDAKKFLVDFRSVLAEVDWIKNRFIRYKDNDEKLRKLVERYK